MNSKFTKLVLSIILAIAAVIFGVYFNQKDSKISLDKPSSGATKYSKYNFGSPATTIRIGIQPLYAPVAVLTETIRRDLLLKEKLSELGYKLEFFDFLKGADVNQYIGNKKLDVGLGGDMPAVAAAALYKANVTALAQYGFCSLIAHESSNATSLRSYKIAYAKGSNAHFTLLKLASSFNIDIRDLNLVSVDVNSMPALFRSGSIDAFYAWEPTPTIVLSKDKNSRAIHKDICTGYLYFRRDFNKHSQIVSKLITASLIRSVEWLRWDAENLKLAISWAFDHAKQFTTEDVGTLKNWSDIMGNDLISYKNISCEIPSRFFKADGKFQQVVKFLKNEGVINRKMSPKEILSKFDASIISTISNQTSAFKTRQIDYRYK